MSAHTPGPWRIKGPSAFDPGRSDGGDYAILDSAGMIIAEAIRLVGKNDERPAEANARLIAAAPKLLVALSALLHATMYKDHPAESQLAIDAIAEATQP